MSCTISDLKSTNRNLEDEKSSLLTAIRLIKSDYSQLGIKAAVKEVENEGPATWKVPKQNAPSKPASPQTDDSNVTGALETSNQYAIFTEANTNTQQKQMPTKSYGSEQSQHVRQQDPVVKRRTSMTKTRSRLAVLGDSMIKHINPRQLQNGVKPKIAVKTFPGATIADMSHYAKPTLSTAPDEIILRIGTNDLKAKTPEAVINAAANLGESITQLHKDTKLTFSEIITRVDDESLTRKNKTSSTQANKPTRSGNIGILPPPPGSNAAPRQAGPPPGAGSSQIAASSPVATAVPLFQPAKPANVPVSNPPCDWGDFTTASTSNQHQHRHQCKAS